MPNLTLLLLTHNEEKNLQQYWTWLDKCPIITEIVAVDDLSTDNTLSILKSLASKNRKVIIRSRGLAGDFSTQRQFALNFAANDWILWLDADEKPSDEMIAYLNHFSPKHQKNVYSFRRLDSFLGQTLLHGETGWVYFTRLFHRRYGHFSGQVHEIWSSRTIPIKHEEILFHYPHRDLKSFIEKINFYSTIRARELFLQKTPVSLIEIIFYPLAKFLKNYLFLLGFLDSTPGIIHALSMSFHSFLVRSKLWHLSSTSSSS